MNKYRILKAIYLWVLPRLKKAHVDVFKNDLRCTNCNEWYSISGTRYSHHIDGTGYGYVTTCGQCGERTHWNTVAAPVALRCDENGTLI